MFCGFPLGGVGSEHLIAGYGWQAVFYVGGMLPLALLPLLWFGLPESICFLAARRDRYQNSSRELLRIVRRLDPGGRCPDDCRWLINEERLKGSPIKALFLDGRTIGRLPLWVVCVPKTLSELMTQWKRLSWRNDWAALFRCGRAGLAIQVEVAA
jgi:MFS transporter, AAHS family, 4-hydroxybenzoate transporter